jgi:hypothetical protein
MQVANNEKETKRQQFMDTQLKDYQNLENELLDKKVDPSRFWGSRSTGQKIAAYIGMAFGGLAAGFGGKNVTKDMMDNAIQQDIDSQKSEIDKLKDISSAKKNMYGLFMEKFNDERQAEAATKATMLQKVELQMKETAARHKAPELQANALKSIGEVQVMKNAALLQFEQAAQGKAQKLLLSGGSQLPAGLDIEHLTEDQRTRYVPGVGLASTKEGAKEVREFKAVADDINSGINELIAMTNSSGKSINPAARAKAEALANMLKGQLRVPIVGPGAVSESEWKLLDRIVANPATIFSLDPISRASLETVNRRIQDQLANKAKVNGLKPVGQQVKSFQPR